MVAEKAGLPPLELMEGFFNPDGLGTAFSFLKFDKSPEAEHYQLRKIVNQLPIKWSGLKSSPLHELLNHSDCDGSISYGKAKKIADELTKLLPLFDYDPEDIEWHGKNYYYNITKNFIEGCYNAYEAKEKLKFH